VIIQRESRISQERKEAGAGATIAYFGSKQEALDYAVAIAKTRVAPYWGSSSMTAGEGGGRETQCVAGEFPDGSNRPRPLSRPASASLKPAGNGRPHVRYPNYHDQLETGRYPPGRTPGARYQPANMDPVVELEPNPGRRRRPIAWRIKSPAKSPIEFARKQVRDESRRPVSRLRQPGSSVRRSTFGS